MDYETFKQEMTEDLKQRLYERGVEDVEMSFHNVEKANQHYCNIPKKVENMNKKYCECSAGWYMRLFSEVFEKSVTVTIVDTIVNGASECVFEISDYV